MTLPTYPDDWDARRKRVYERDNYTCQNCGTQGGRRGDSELHAHHVRPRSAGGSHDERNLVTLCRDCHNRQHSHDITRNPGYEGTDDTGSGHGFAPVSSERSQPTGPDSQPQQTAARARRQAFDPYDLPAILLSFPVKHLALPVASTVGYLYVIRTVVDLVSGIHWTLSVLAPVGIALAVGVLGLAYPLVVAEGYVLTGGVVAWYLLSENRLDAVSEAALSVLAGGRPLVVAFVVPSVLFGLFGPLLIVGSAWMGGLSLSTPSEQSG
ncbi:HNH endonuclease [Halobellus ordinarius]|uniref:HNH endonuclease n=1 Tax=Halobellus ordinarius TaxID=3075120 RepID=UPI00288054A5|nr:HNH endonuclease [Halobellus sp. ZY16]